MEILRFIALLLALAISTQGSSDYDELTKQIATMSRQLMMQQFYVEEQTRSNGASGLKQIRVDSQGTRPYHASSHSSRTIASIHDHANNDRTVGMGELAAVLNGVEFRTRHNDYRLRMKSTTSSEYGATEDIEFPPVPPEVTQHVDVDDQTVEMREWFKAWQTQDHTVRDYRPYFRPVLCYLEGTWTHSDQNSIDEPFDSDRHHIDASSWLELQEKIRFTSYAGLKDGLENLAYLPTTVIEIINETIPVLAQWNFAIHCHPVSRDLPLNRLGLVDDLKVRLSWGSGGTIERYASSRAARYQVATFDEDRWRDGSARYSLLDELMEEIPGLDNYGANITEDLGGDISYHIDQDIEGPLNIGFYNRHFRVEDKGAMGLKTRRRGYADENLFVSMNTQPKVAGLKFEKDCRRGRECGHVEGKWSYAIPLEIIYLTPLSSWNPYDIAHRGDSKSKEGKQIHVGPNGRRRTGAAGADLAYNGTNSKVYYRTPCGFFSDEYLADPADTTQSSTFVLDPSDTPRCVRASGIRIFMPDIPGVGTLRQRYPIMPIHGEGSQVWKELEALKEIVLRPNKYKHVFYETPPTTNGNDDGDDDDDDDDDTDGPDDTQLTFTLRPSTAEYGGHTHTFVMSAEEHTHLLNGYTITKIITDQGEGHSHQISVKYVRTRYIMTVCDGNKRCFDGHPRRVFPL